MSSTVKLNSKSPVTDNGGRDLYRVKMTDGMNVKTIFIYAFAVQFAIEKAKVANPYLLFKIARKINQSFNQQ